MKVGCSAGEGPTHQRVGLVRGTSDQALPKTPAGNSEEAGRISRWETAWPSPCGDLGDVLFMPFDPEKVKVDTRYRDPRRADCKHLYALLDHNLESVKPGLYTVELPDYGVKVRLTTTDRTGRVRYGDHSFL